MTRIVFMGTPDFAVPALQALIASSDYDVIGVVTQPDRPGNRGKLIQPPVKVTAESAGIPVIQLTRLREPGAFEQLQAWSPDLIVVAAFGQILRANVLDLPVYGCVNVHASLLPRWRGAAPIQAALRAGDTVTGITIMRMDAGLDTGGMILKRSTPITDQDTGESLHDRLCVLGGEALIAALPGYLSGELPPQTQDESLQTYAPMLKKEDGAIDWNTDAASIDRQVRAYHVWPGTYTIFEGEPLKILPVSGQAAVMDGSAGVGEVLRTDRGVAVGTGNGLYVIGLVQAAGKKPTAPRDFANGKPAFIGARLG